MIKINLAPERGRRRKVGFKGIKLGLPAFNLGMLFGVVRHSGRSDAIAGAES